MRQVPSSTCSTAAGNSWFRRARRALIVTAVSLALAVGAPGLAAAQDDLMARHAELQSRIEAAREQVDAHSAGLATAQAALEASRVQLTEARAALDRTRAELEQARGREAELASQLAREQELLREATRATAKARADVEAQQALIAKAAREAFQNRSNLAGVPVVLGSASYSDLQQRVQWNTTIFDSTSSRLAELENLEQRLVDAEAEQARIEAEVAAAKKESSDHVATIAALEASAAQQTADVETLVAANERYAADASTLLEADNANYTALQAEESAVEGQIAARVADQLAHGAPREDIAKLVAMGVISTDPASYPLVNEGAQMILSPQGFIRPVKARPGSAFGQRFHPILKYWRMHNGTDFGAPCGTPLHAAQSGTVVQARVQGSFGNYTVIDHGLIQGRSLMTGYAHQSSMVVSAGQRVEMGQLIGYVGTTGLSTGCHLHLQVYLNGKPVDPMTHIP